MKILIVGKEISNKSYGDYINIAMPLVEIGNFIEFYDISKSVTKNTLEISKLISEFKPELIFFIPVEDELNYDFIKKLTIDIPTLAYFYDDTWRIRYSLKWAQVVNYIVTTDVNWFLNFKMHKEKVIPCPFFINTNQYLKTKNKIYKYDISFVGQYHPYRELVIKKIRKLGYNVHVFGNGWNKNSTISFHEMIEVFNNTKINLNLSNCVNFDLRNIFDFKNISFIGALKAIKLLITATYKIDMKIHEMVKARFFEINACGGFQIGFYAQGLEKVFEIGNEIEIYSNFDELKRKIDYYLVNEDKRELIAMTGYHRTLKFHDSKFRLKTILANINFNNR